MILCEYYYISLYKESTILVFHENLIDTCNVLSMTIPTYTNITVYIILFTDIRLCEFDVIRSSQISEDTWKPYIKVL